ncbi:hypothetical protein PL331_07385 [Acinetobacter baumannii]|nr:hypothetical protein PL331_07385 [Acinetobacter baumannii]
MADHENPMDIPEGRWIDIRLHEEPEPEPEVEETLTETPVDFQPTNLSQAVAAAMNGVEPQKSQTQTKHFNNPLKKRVFYCLNFGEP